MIDITYLNTGNQEFHLTYDNYADFERAQLSCTAPLADYYQVIKVTYNGHELDYTGRFGDLFFYLNKLDHSQYQ